MLYHIIISIVYRLYLYYTKLYIFSYEKFHWYKLMSISQYQMHAKIVEMSYLGNDYNFLKVRVDFACHVHKI